MKLEIFKIKKFLKVCSINTCLAVINVETSLKMMKTVICEYF